MGSFVITMWTIDYKILTQNRYGIYVVVLIKQSSCSCAEPVLHACIACLWTWRKGAVTPKALQVLAFCASNAQAWVFTFADKYKWANGAFHFNFQTVTWKKYRVHCTFAPSLFAEQFERMKWANITPSWTLAALWKLCFARVPSESCERLTMVFNKVFKKMTKTLFFAWLAVWEHRNSRLKGPSVAHTAL